MSKRARVATAVLFVAGLAAADGRREVRVSSRATGTFDVKVTPIAADPKGGEGFGRMALDKQFHGDLEARSQGEMMTAGTAVEGSAGYVALERVDGSLRGRKGSFVLLHQGTMQKAKGFDLSVTVLPDSGTAELTGLLGKMKIVIGADGSHSYELDYTLPEVR